MNYVPAHMLHPTPKPSTVELLTPEKNQFQHLQQSDRLFFRKVGDLGLKVGKDFENPVLAEG